MGKERKLLSSIRVLDFSHLLPGPFCTMILARMGCEVTKVELPFWRDKLFKKIPSLYRFLNRNKTCLELNFRTGEGKRKLDKMLKGADILVEGFRPGLMAKLGLDYGSVRKKHPHIIYCSITGYGLKSALSRLAGHDLNFLSMSGFLWQAASGSHPSLPPAQMADLAGSFYAAIQILGALHKRGKTKKGRRIDISLTHSAQSLLPLSLAEYDGTEKPEKLLKNWWQGSHPFYNIYPALDGKYLAVAPVEKAYQINLLKLMGLHHLQPMLDDLEGNREILQRELGKTFLTKTSKEWASLLIDKDVCVTPVLSIPESILALAQSSQTAVKRK